MKYKSIALIASAALLACGCSTNANKGGDKSDSKAKDTIVVAYSEGGQTLSPAEANDVTSDTLIVAAYDQLVTYGTTVVDGKAQAKTDEIAPMIATSWKTSNNNKTYTFQLRKDIKFEDGSSLTSDDVVKTFKYIKDSSSASFMYGLAGIKTVKALNDYAVQVDLTAPNHLFLQILPMYPFSIVNMDQVSANGGPKWLDTHTAGSSAYRIDRWDSASEAVLTRNDEYWGKKPAIRQVNIKFIAEPSNRVELLKAGAVDIALEVPAKDVQKLSKAPGVRVDSRKSNKILYLALNNDIRPFDNTKVRQAISYAIPYDKLISDVMAGQAVRMRSAVSSAMPGYTAEGYTYEHDLKQAKKLLSEAGYPDGFSFDMTLGSGFDDWNDDAVLIQSELAKIGVKMNIKKMARAQFLDAIGKKKVQSYISRAISYVNDPGYFLGIWFSADGTQNKMNFDSPQADALWKQASTEPNQERRKELYGKAQKIITAQAPWAYLYEYNIVVALRKGLQGYTAYPDAIIRFDQLTTTPTSGS